MVQRFLLLRLLGVSPKCRATHSTLDIKESDKTEGEVVYVTVTVRKNIEEDAAPASNTFLGEGYHSYKSGGE